MYEESFNIILCKKQKKIADKTSEVGHAGLKLYFFHAKKSGFLMKSTIHNYSFYCGACHIYSYCVPLFSLHSLQELENQLLASWWTL